ncbi:uncharacterized protein LOC141863261 isoform X3 [Acropora palmata]|uniref:uncharacterized protein LOC141863261 isoform X3 n=1 Tax=Acropora palmata TaxID=6131 RepID=UPI003D9FBF7C
MTSNQLFFSYVCNYSTCACFFIRLLKIFAEWKNISFTIQDAIFEEDENERITTYMMSRSFQLFSNQWFETSHKEQRRFCYQATNHDSSADGQSKKPTCQGISGCYHCPLAEKKDYGKYIN